MPRGLPTEALVAHSMVARFGDYLPFYRQSEIYRRQDEPLSAIGPRTMANDLDRSMLAEWVRTGPEGIEPSSGRIEGMNARSAGRGGQRSCWRP